MMRQTQKGCSRSSLLSSSGAARTTNDPQKKSKVANVWSITIPYHRHHTLAAEEVGQFLATLHYDLTYPFRPRYGAMRGCYSPMRSERRWWSIGLLHSSLQHSTKHIDTLKLPRDEMFYLSSKKTLLLYFTSLSLSLTNTLHPLYYIASTFLCMYTSWLKELFSSNFQSKQQVYQVFFLRPC